MDLYNNDKISYIVLGASILLLLLHILTFFMDINEKWDVILIFIVSFLGILTVIVIVVRNSKKEALKSVFCQNCEKLIFPTRNFSLKTLVLLTLLGILPGFFYYYHKPKICPECHKILKQNK